MPVDDVVGPRATAQPWTCPRCGRENKATWSQCPACESDQSGRTPEQRAPAVARPRANPVYLLLGVLLLAALAVAAVFVAEPVWTWVGEQWTTFVEWVDQRS
jgi:hypothetical protein